MRGKPRIALYRRLGASVSVALACCIFPAGAQAVDMYSYPSADDNDDAAAPSAHADRRAEAAPAAQEGGYQALPDSPYAARRDARLRDASAGSAATNGWTRAGGIGTDNASSASATVPKLLIPPLPPAPVIASAPPPLLSTPVPAPAAVALTAPAPMQLTPAIAGGFAVPVAPASAPAYTPAYTMAAPQAVANAAPLTLAVKPVAQASAPVTVGFAPSVAFVPALTDTALKAPPAEDTTAKNLAVLAPASGVLPLQPQPALSGQSIQIADTLPPEKPPARKPSVTLERMHKNPLENETEVQSHEGVGIKISVRRPKADVARMLDDAYHSLVSGNQEDAIALYKQVLEAQPSNKLALLGLATTYHRAGQLQLARPLYGKLLAIDPHNIEGLNNFLVLLADESPQGALTELGQLEKTHPTFSPVPAQMAVIYEKMGDYPKAVKSMTHAIELSPENLKYRYDMAIMLDKQGDWPSASLFYQQLISASERGEKIPTEPEEIQKRLTFIRSNRPNT